MAHPKGFSTTTNNFTVTLDKVQPNEDPNAVMLVEKPVQEMRLSVTDTDTSHVESVFSMTMGLSHIERGKLVSEWYQRDGRAVVEPASMSFIMALKDDVQWVTVAMRRHWVTHSGLDDGIVSFHEDTKPTTVTVALSHRSDAHVWLKEQMHSVDYGSYVAKSLCNDVVYAVLCNMEWASQRPEDDLVQQVDELSLAE